MATEALLFCKAPEDTKAKVLQMYSPALDAFPDSSIVQSAKRFASSIQRHQEDLPTIFKPLETCSEEVLTKVPLIWAMNSHAFYGNSALFDMGSKLIHYCGGNNTTYHTHLLDNGKGNHVANRDIAPGGLHENVR
jgi:hypothetical protein